MVVASQIDIPVRPILFVICLEDIATLVLPRKQVNRFYLEDISALGVNRMKVDFPQELFQLCMIWSCYWGDRGGGRALDGHPGTTLSFFFV